MDHDFDTARENSKSDKWILFGRKTGFVVFALATLLAAPYACYNYFNVTYERGYYPSDADSIAILICSYFIAWLFMAIMVMAKVVSLLKHYPAEVLMVLWSKKQPRRCMGWTMVILIIVVFKICSCVGMIKDNMAFNAVYDAAWVVLAVWLWSLVIAEMESE